MTTMKAALWYHNADLRVVDLPVGRPGPHEMLVEVVACGICGSDVVEWYRLPRAPLVQGHEVGARVLEVGGQVTRFAPGDRVALAPKVPCLVCDTCRAGHHPQCTEVKERLPGGFAERILVPAVRVERGAYRLPDSVSFEQGTFVEPLGCVLRSQALAGLSEGQTVLVLGCGMSGLLQVQAARLKGCRVAATDVDPKRLALASRLGAELALPAGDDVPAKVRAHFGRKADAVLLCTGALAAVEQAWASVERGGAVVFFAVPGPDKDVVFPAARLWTQEVRVLTSYYCGPSDLEQSLALLAAGAVDVEALITHRLPLARIAEGFRLVQSGEAIKVLINP